MRLGDAGSSPSAPGPRSAVTVTTTSFSVTFAVFGVIALRHRVCGRPKAHRHRRYVVVRDGHHRLMRRRRRRSPAVGRCPKTSSTHLPIVVHAVARRRHEDERLRRLAAVERHADQAPRSSPRRSLRPWLLLVIGIVTVRSGSALRVTVTTTSFSVHVQGSSESSLRHRVSAAPKLTVTAGTSSSVIDDRGLVRGPVAHARLGKRRAEAQLHRLPVVVHRCPARAR